MGNMLESPKKGKRKSFLKFMLREKTVTLLKIYPEEMRMAALMAVLFFIVQAGIGVGDSVAFALFVSKNAALLPYVYVPMGVIVFLISLGYTASLGRFKNAQVVMWFLSGFALLMLGEWIVAVLFHAQITKTFWLTVNSMGIILGTLIWTAAGEVCDARQAKRLFPVFASMGILGSITGNLFTKALSQHVGMNNMILVYALILGGALLILRMITGSYFKPEPPAWGSYNFISDLRVGFDYVRGSGLFRLLAVCAVLYSILFFTVTFVFSISVAAHYAGDQTQLVGFKGLFNSATALFSFLVSLIIANRLYGRIGIVNSILLMPATYLIGFLGSYVLFGFDSLVSLRLVQQIILAGVVSTAWNTVFNIVPLERRGQVLAFMNGVPAQIGVVLSGLLLIASSFLFASPQEILLLGAVISLAAFYFTWKMRAEYGNALVSALQAGRMEVFSNEEDAFAGVENDPAALQATLTALHDSKPFTRRLAADMLAKMNNPLAVPDLVERLSDDAASVRAAATQALADLGAKSALHEIVFGLEDSDDSVREKTLASFPKLEIASSPELIRLLERLLEDPNIRIQARAAMVLIYLGETSHANDFLARLLQDEDAKKRFIAIDAFRAIAANASAAIPFNADLIIEAMNDPAPIVRKEAVRVAVYLKDDSIFTAIAAHLGDGDAGVRKTASESLRQVWPASRSVVIRALNEMEGDAISFALKSIPPGDMEVLGPLRSYIQREVAGTRYLRMMAEALPQKGRATKMLLNTLRQRISASEDRLIEAVGLFGNPRAMDLVRRSLNAGDASTRVAALEAFETLGDKQIINEVLPILDRSGMFQAGDEQHMTINDVISELLVSPESWLRALTVYVISEQKLLEFKPEVRKLTYDAVQLVKDAARNSVSQMDGTIIMKKIVNLKTLKTLSTLDRILLLREVPMFSALSPEDLEKIAEVADELLYSNESLLCSEGEPGNTLFVIASGKVDVIKRIGNKENILATQGAGEFVGEMAILESAPRSATLKAHGDARVLMIDGDAFNAILLDRPEVAVSVLRHMSSRVRQLNEKIGAAG